MDYDCQDIPSASSEYGNLLQEYQNFQEYRIQTSQLLIATQTLIESKNPQAFDLYTQALKTHENAFKSFTQMIVLYEIIVQEYWQIYTSSLN
jgi:hypothetical protein